ncbi:hypothetical protein CU633_18070 [Bacillus sp. V3-13]|nr:hypothetical protein CU633_18070 [Bacillus sp. V3-13]
MQFNETRTEKRPRGNPGKNPKPAQVKVTWQVCAKAAGIDQAVTFDNFDFKTRGYMIRLECQ